ncbi:hypothetical protein ABKN59_003201 [Abortiporus biennis]
MTISELVFSEYKYTYTYIAHLRLHLLPFESSNVYATLCGIITRTRSPEPDDKRLLRVQCHNATILLDFETTTIRNPWTKISPKLRIISD